MSSMNVNDGENEIDLPLIDLSLLNSGQGDSKLEEVTAKIKVACQEWGFFRVINHGVGPHLIQAIDSVSRDLFTLPAEIKENGTFSDYFDGYSGASTASPYRQAMAFPSTLLSDSIDRISNSLWPRGNPDFCKAVKEYSCKVEELANTLIKLILTSLGLDVSRFEKSWEGRLRMNYYSSPIAPTSINCALTGHKDFSFLTILYQDQIGGLQVLTKEGKWASVKPLRDSFAVNIGDSLEIWSNCRYRSAEHRVVYGGWSCRLSLAFFMHFAEDAEVYAAEEMVDDDHSRRYRSSTMNINDKLCKMEALPIPFA